MKAVFNAVQLGHKPTRYMSKGRMVHYPEQPERVRRLLHGLRKAQCNIHAARKHEKSDLLSVHSARYVDFLETAHQRWKTLGNAFDEVMPSTRPVPGLNAYPQSVIGRAGWHLSDFSCPVVADTFKVAKASADTALTAAELVLAGERAVYALCRPPGHHAMHERAAGFCYFNNTALAAKLLRASNSKVAILDIDVHHGNGTQSIFYADPTVFTVSIHADPDDFYPFYHGFSDQTGIGEGKGYNLNLPIPVKSNDAMWGNALASALEAIDEFAPTALVVALGLDAHSHDPLGGGDVSTEGYRLIGGLIGSLNLPTVIVQEGGYLTPYLGDTLANFLTGFEAPE